MNNYILNSGSCSYDNHTYNYIKTDNHYAYPYVFMTDDDVELKYVYFKNMPSNSGSGTMGFKDPDGNEQMGARSIYYNIKAYGVATIKEAAAIGETLSDSSRLITSSSVGDYNCQIKNPTPSGTNYPRVGNKKCVNYIDLEKKEDDVYIKLYFRTGNPNYSHIEGYIVSTLAPSTIIDPHPEYLAEDISTFSVIINGINNESLSFSDRVNRLSEPLNYEKHRGIRFVGLYLTSRGNYAYNVKVKNITYSNEATSAYGSEIGTTYSFSGRSAVGTVIVDSGGHDTGNTITAITSLSTPKFAEDFTLNNIEIQSIINTCRNYSDVFTGNGTLLNPYIVYIWLELSYNS